MFDRATILENIHRARNELSRYLPPTPLVHNAWISERLGCQVFLKLESMQPIGSFKIRGAAYRLSKMPLADRPRGVIAGSAGNHAQGVAWAARKHGTTAQIIMPRTASLIKAQNTRALGAEVILEGDSFDEVAEITRRRAAETGRTLIHAYQDPDIIAGQGTLGLELLDQLPDLDVVIGSLGGGGMMTGVGIALRAMKPTARLIGCQSTGADAIVRSLAQSPGLPGVVLPISTTFADGTSIRTASDQMVALLRESLDESVAVDDDEIVSAVFQLMERGRVVSEGSGAIPLAVLERNHARFAGKKVVLIVSGGNIDVNLLNRIIDRGLIRAGRRIRVTALISDKPGSLSKLTELIARLGASVIQVIHDRNEPSVGIEQTGVALTLETRSAEHSAEVIAALRANTLRLEIAG